MSHTPPVDSKGAAIDEINLIISTVMLGVKRVVNKYNNPQIAPKQMNDELDEVYHEARQAILAILAQEVKRKTILELKRLQAYGLNHEITTPIIEDRIKAIERLG